MSDPFLLRPHHALCICFFEGKGYSEDFVRHMGRVIETLEASDPVVTLHTSCDCICIACPKNVSGKCIDSEKVRAIDDRVLALLSYQAGEKARWSELYEQANDKIIRRGRLQEVCRDCQWLYLCNK